MKKPLAFLILLCSLGAFAQSDLEKLSIRANELELKLLCHHLFHEKKKDAEKQEYNRQLLKKFEEILLQPNSFDDYQFDSLRNDIGVLTAADNKFRIINWNVAKDDGTQEYFGFIQEHFSETTKKGLFKRFRVDSMQLYPLIDKSAEIKNPENAITDNKKWFGLLYNRIIIKKVKSKTYYTLLGWDGNDKFSQKKIIDVLTFDNKGIPHFGADIFNYQKKYPKRIIFEYSATCSMSMRYSNKKDSIVFGHLAPIQPKLEGQFQYYCSDLSFDGFGFKKGKWNYGEDVNAVNERDDNDKFYHDPHDRTTTNNQSNKVVDRKKKKKKTQ
ncbi:MAG: hypothetical protein JWO44_2747 [Bacteroidetes bacterium]|nr:hypothetical protein [Bacteroidota bacterium]